MQCWRVAVVVVVVMVGLGFEVGTRGSFSEQHFFFRGEDGDVNRRFNSSLNPAASRKRKEKELECKNERRRESQKADLKVEPQAGFRTFDDASRLVFPSLPLSLSLVETLKSNASIDIERRSKQGKKAVRLASRSQRKGSKKAKRTRGRRERESKRVRSEGKQESV
ncbi:hypothetical protein BDY24DRAFT_44659 [Mrakia frigida]|uniref:uncharacterized protein n=1 Tax=Mrakia frigida TaxID=29902 RepID=UPI003FCBFD7F